MKPVPHSKVRQARRLLAAMIATGCYGVASPGDGSAQGMSRCEPFPLEILAQAGNERELALGATLLTRGPVRTDSAGNTLSEPDSVLRLTAGDYEGARRGVLTVNSTPDRSVTRYYQAYAGDRCLRWKVTVRPPPPEEMVVQFGPDGTSAQLDLAVRNAPAPISITAAGGYAGLAAIVYGDTVPLELLDDGRLRGSLRLPAASCQLPLGPHTARIIDRSAGGVEVGTVVFNAYSSQDPRISSIRPDTAPATGERIQLRIETEHLFKGYSLEWSWAGSEPTPILGSTCAADRVTAQWLLPRLRPGDGSRYAVLRLRSEGRVAEDSLRLTVPSRTQIARIDSVVAGHAKPIRFVITDGSSPDIAPGRYDLRFRHADVAVVPFIITEAAVYRGGRQAYLHALGIPRELGPGHFEYELSNDQGHRWLGLMEVLAPPAAAFNWIRATYRDTDPQLASRDTIHLVIAGSHLDGVVLETESGGALDLVTAHYSRGGGDITASLVGRPVRGQPATSKVYLALAGVRVDSAAVTVHPPTDRERLLASVEARTAGRVVANDRTIFVGENQSLELVTRPLDSHPRERLLVRQGERSLGEIFVGEASDTLAVSLDLTPGDTATIRLVRASDDLTLHQYRVVRSRGLRLDKINTGLSAAFRYHGEWYVLSGVSLSADFAIPCNACRNQPGLLNAALRSLTDHAKPTAWVQVSSVETQRLGTSEAEKRADVLLMGGVGLGLFDAVTIGLGWSKTGRPVWSFMASFSLTDLIAKSP